MIPVLLTRIKTKDGVSLDGVVVLPKRKGHTACIWIHGLGSRFSLGQALIQELSALCAKNKIAYLKFNTRGHDVVASEGKHYIGSAFEKFIDSPKDIRATIAFAKRLGYKRIILAGHSTGANKALYYIYKTRDRNVKGLICAGAVSDMAEWKIRGARYMKRSIAIAKKLSKKKPNALMPEKYGIKTASRYLSLYEPGHEEDVFPYHNPRARWKELKSVRIPVAIILGSRDKYLDRSAGKLIKMFQRNAALAKSFSGIVIKGADHGFHKKEKELARGIIRWIKKIEE